MEIMIGSGVGPIVFGMTQEEVQEILGYPDKSSENAKPSSITITYNDIMMKFGFDQDENCKLYDIEIANPITTLFGQRVIGKTKQEILSLLDQNGYFEHIEEDYEKFGTITCEEICCEFEFELNQLVYITFSPLWENEDEIIWPIGDEDLSRVFPLEPSPEGIDLTGIKNIGEAVLGSGMHALSFGMTVNDIMSVLGEPDKIIPEYMDDVTAFEFNEELLRLKIDEFSDPVLYSIETHNPSTIMFGELIFGKSMTQVRELVAANGYHDMKYTDMDYFEILWYASIQTTFCFEFNRLIEVEFSPFRDQDGEWIWPSTGIHGDSSCLAQKK